MRPKVSERQCDEHPNRKGIPIEELAKIVDSVFRELFGCERRQYLASRSREPESLTAEMRRNGAKADLARELSPPPEQIRKARRLNWNRFDCF